MPSKFVKIYNSIFHIYFTIYLNDNFDYYKVEKYRYIDNKRHLLIMYTDIYIYSNKFLCDIIIYVTNCRNLNTIYFIHVYPGIQKTDKLNLYTYKLCCL